VFFVAESFHRFVLDLAVSKLALFRQRRSIVNDEFAHRFSTEVRACVCVCDVSFQRNNQMSNKFLNVINPPRPNDNDNIPFNLAFPLVADYSLVEELVDEKDVVLVEDDVHTRPTVSYMKRVSEVEVINALWEIK
jgi:hypothetical protein